MAGLDVEKKDGEGTTPHAQKIAFLEYGLKNSGIAFFVRNCLVMIVCPRCNSICAFAPVLCPKKRFCAHSQRKVPILAFLRRKTYRSVSVLGASRHIAGTKQK